MKSRRQGRTEKDRKAELSKGKQGNVGYFWDGIEIGRDRHGKAETDKGQEKKMQGRRGFYIAKVQKNYDQVWISRKGK